MANRQANLAIDIVQRLLGEVAARQANEKTRNADSIHKSHAEVREGRDWVNGLGRKKPQSER